MKTKWRKVIWAILAVQLFLLHLLFMEYFLRNIYQLDSFIRRGVNHFGLPYVLYGRWKQFVVLAWLASAVFVMLINYLNYVRFRRSCIGQIYMIADESVKQSLKDAVSETGLYGKEKEKTGRNFLYGSRTVREPFVIGFRDPILILPEREYSAQVLHFIFLHECYHIRHKDTLYKLFMLLMHSFLWFQPLIYLLISVSYRDVEVACDEAVVEGKDIAARKEYGYALLECLKMEGEQGQVYSTYFYHGKRMMKARISAIMKEEKRPDSLAYAAIVILLMDVVFSFYCIGDNLYDSYRAKLTQLQAESFGYDENGVPRTSFYDGYELPENFSQAAVDDMIKLTPVSEDAYYNERNSEDIYEWKEYSELPYEAEGPWQVRLKDADYYVDAVILLLQRYVSYFDDPDRSSQWTSEGSWYTIAETVNSRLLAGDKNEAVFSVICKYYVGDSERDLAEFPQELKDRAQIAHEKDGYYAYFDWSLRICMVKDYVFELEGIAETEDVLQAYMEHYEQADFSDIPKIDLVYGIEMTSLETGVEENFVLSAGVGDNAYQVDTSEDVLKVSGADGEWMEVPITLEELYGRGDEMDGKLTSLQKGSYQVDENKIVFAYGGDNAVPFSVVFYDEESQSFKKAVVTYEFYGGRKIYVNFPENGQEGFLIFTGERVVWHEISFLFRTEDCGKSWQYVGAVPDVLTEGHSLTMGAVFISNSVGFVTIRSSEEPDIWRTQDGGKTWEYQELSDVPEYYSIAYAPEAHGNILCLYIGMEEYSEYGGTKAKYESTDEGRTWEYKGLVIRK